jgi:hypothetical protein
MPPLTHFLGPAIDSGSGSQTTRYLRQLSITSELIAKLPRVASFRQKMHRGVVDAVAFQSTGFDVSVQFTYEMHPASEKEAWEAMRDKTRNAIRNGEKIYKISTDFDPQAFTEFYKKNLYAEGKNEHIDFGIARGLTRRCLEEDCGRFFVARDIAGSPKAAIFVVWDQTSCYYLMATRAKESTYGATSAALWASVKFAMSKQQIFDFDGIYNAGSAKFFASFGGNVSPRFVIQKANLAYRLRREVRRRPGYVV